VVGDWDGVVVAASPEAAEFGVRPGLPVHHARKLCPQASIVDPDPPAVARLRRLAAVALYDLVPVVEPRLDGTFLLDLDGCAQPVLAIRETRRRLREVTGREPHLGLAPGPFSARLAAARARPGRLLKVDDAAEFLAPLSIAELDLEREALERLDLLGLRTLGDLARLGPRQLQSQIGQPGRLAARLARGEEPVGLEPWRPPSITSVSRQFEPALDDREALLFVARALCDDLGRELGLRGAGARRVRVRLQLDGADPEGRESAVRQPLSAGPELFGLVSSWLRDWAPAAPIAELAVELPQLEPAGRRQLRLWAGGDGSLEEVTAAVERLQERFGEDVAVRPKPFLVDSPVAAQRYRLEPA
jgi:nucleotidyltransferase/DNA polymerase involved in DNA repair